MKELLEIGFNKVGEWKLENDILVYHLDKTFTSKNILYCFVSENNIKYIGKSIKTVSQRLNGYKKPNISQTTNHRINKIILNKLKGQINVDIYLFEDNYGLNFRGHKINLSAGLEDNLISEFLPEWNSLGKGEVKTVKKKSKETTEKFKSTNYNDIEGEKKFFVALGKKYYNDGFFNIRIKHSESFGLDYSKIKIQLGENPLEYCIGDIDRRANTNGTPRIFARKKYKDWVQKNFERDDFFHVEIIEKDFIILTKKKSLPLVFTSGG